MNQKLEVKENYEEKKFTGDPENLTVVIKEYTWLIDNPFPREWL